MTKVSSAPPFFFVLRTKKFADRGGDGEFLLAMDYKYNKKYREQRHQATACSMQLGGHVRLQPVLRPSIPLRERSDGCVLCPVSN